MSRANPGRVDKKPAKVCSSTFSRFHHTPRIRMNCPTHSIVGLFLGAILLSGCQSGVQNIPVSPNSETGRAIGEMDYMAAHGGIKPSEEPDYHAKAVEFIQYAQAGNLAQMLADTSPQSYATESDSLRTVYADQVVPQFQNVTITWNDKSAPCHDEQNHPGLLFTGTVHGNKTYSFDVAVYRENGKLWVTNIRKHG